MPRATFQYVYTLRDKDSVSKADLGRIDKMLEQLDREALRADIARREKFEVACTDLKLLSEKTGFAVSFDMDATPGRTSTVKTIFDALKRIERRVQIHAHFLIAAEFNDEHWNRNSGILVSAEMLSTQGFIVGARKSRFWWFPVGVAVGALTCYAALNFESMMTLIESARPPSR